MQLGRKCVVPVPTIAISLYAPVAAMIVDFTAVATPAAGLESAVTCQTCKPLCLE